MTNSDKYTPPLLRALVREPNRQFRASDLGQRTGVPKKFVRRALTVDADATRPVQGVVLQRKGGYWWFASSSRVAEPRPPRTKPPTPEQFGRVIDAYDRVALQKVRAEQGFLRTYVLKGADRGACVVCRRDFPVDLLVAAHIKQRARCTPKERKDYQTNVVAMCKLGCDDLFERGYISAMAGDWVANGKKLKVATEAVREYVETVAGKTCREWSSARKYFDWHSRYHGLTTADPRRPGDGGA